MSRSLRHLHPLRHAVGLWLLGACAALGLDVPLNGPLTRQAAVPGTLPSGPLAIEAVLSIPADAPADLGVGAWATTADGRWFQRTLTGALRHGSQRVRVELGAGDPVTAREGAWTPAAAATLKRAGLFFWTATASTATIGVGGLTALALPPPEADARRLMILDADPVTLVTGMRWDLHLLPQPLPGNPYDPEEFAVDLLVERPDGVSERIPGFWDQPMAGSDRGDREEVIPAGAPRFTVRYRPRVPGTHRLRLEARWHGGGPVVAEVPTLAVDGAPWDDYPRVDAEDPRFFSVSRPAGAPGKDFLWPICINLRSITDSRSRDAIRTRPTPDRGTLAYAAYLERLGRNGVDTVEVWMSAWNLALEWDTAWPGFHGPGRYHEANAWRLDRLLDLARERGMRLQLVLNHHGQASDRVDAEWANNPYRKRNGGWLDQPIQVFTDARAQRHQERLRRYLVGRYADHPAILSWKLWTEMDLTTSGVLGLRDDLATWHAAAAAHLAGLDVYRHPITSHWCETYRNVWPEVARLPGLSYLCIDAYHKQESERDGILLAHLLMDGMTRKGRLGSYGKPVIISEYGGTPIACPEPQLEAEHASSGFCALVDGYAGSPMLWWFEWVDQGGRFAPYAALKAFIAGEDLRGAKAGSIGLAARDARGDLWARAWSRPGRMLGYLLDPAWQADGSTGPPHQDVQVTVGDAVAAGRMTIAWWDADRGVAIGETAIDHPGGALVLHPPAFTRHLAFKLSRQ